MVKGKQLLPDSRNLKAYSPWARTGTIATLILIGSTFAVAVCIGFLCFLWYGTSDNHVWHIIVIKSWATRAVTITSIVLRTALIFQGGVCLSMLAAIALEKSVVPLASAGSISLLRADGDKSLVPVLTGFAWPLLRKGPRLERQLVLPAVLLVLTTMFLTQFTSTFLLFDIAVRPVPGYNETINVAYNFAYQNDDKMVGYSCPPQSYASLWEASIPPQWPMFAEYSEPPTVQDNVSDTGLSLRAFLPLGAQKGQLVRNYSGKALVLDSRVTCQQPILEGVNSINPGGYLRGRISPSTSTPRLDKPKTVPFTCSIPLNTWSFCELDAGALIYPTVNFSGGLVSEFRPGPGQNKSGAAILLTYTHSKRSQPLNFGPEFVLLDLKELYSIYVIRLTLRRA